MPQRFAPSDLSIPDNLRQRIELWDILPPKSQFQQYGPLTGFLSIKFPQSQFIVKPQALLREIWEIPQDIAPEDVLAIKDIILGMEDHTVDADEEFTREIRRRLSIDSQGALVMTDKKYYPDFVITSYDNTLNLHGENYKRDVVLQFERYLLALGRAGYRWHDKVLGILLEQNTLL